MIVNNHVSYSGISLGTIQYHWETQKYVFV